MSFPHPFPPTRAAALNRLAAVQPAAYARSRNALDGAVTRLSPYITHGLLRLPELLEAVAGRHRLNVQHKLVFELGWREFFRHAWQQHGEGILRSLHEGPLPEAAYAPTLPEDVRQARTGLPVIDQAVRSLYATGYLHNHARMWLASYVVHLRKVHWRAGADWMLGHLLDGDLASNHLSWQWVAGTASHKPYLFNAENVARYAPPDWQVPGSLLDTDYETLDAWARDPAWRAPAGPDREADTIAPPLSAEPLAGPPRLPPSSLDRPDPAGLAGQDVWLVHPWALDDPPSDLPPGTRCLGWWPAEAHAAWPWSPARWDFVGTRMAALAPQALHGRAGDLGRVLQGVRSAATWADPHLPPGLPAALRLRPAPQLFPTVARSCRSFSDWWHRATRGLQALEELPGLAERLQGAGPLFAAPPPRA